MLNRVAPGAHRVTLTGLDPVSRLNFGFRQPFADPQDDTFTAIENETLSIAKPGVLENDLDSQTDAMLVTLVESTKHGELVLQSDGSFTYTPHLNFNREDYFRYRVTDGFMLSDIAEVTITMETAYPWFNGNSPFDINNDGFVSPRDALLLIADLNAGTGGLLPTERLRPLAAPFLDPNRDGYCSARDALAVIAHLNSGAGEQSEGESGQDVAQTQDEASIPSFRELSLAPQDCRASMTEDPEHHLQQLTTQDVTALLTVSTPLDRMPRATTFWEEYDEFLGKDELEEVLSQLVADFEREWDL